MTDPVPHRGSPPDPRRRRLLQVAGTAAALLLAGTAPARAAEPAAPAATDARAVRRVIEGQLAALAANDAERAFSYASAGIRAQMGDAARFMAMVQGGYPMVVRPASVAFFRPRLDDEGAMLQTVQMRDREGRLWLANYRLVRQAQAGWRIDGCQVLPDDGNSST
jgi:hypothetical protein